MKITVLKDSTTGLVTYEYHEEPKELSPKEKEKEEKWHNELMNSVKIHNEFMHRLISAFWSLEITTFEQVWKTVFKEYSQIKELNPQDNTQEKKEHKIEQDFKKSFLKSFVDSLNNKEKKHLFKENLEQVFNVWNNQLNTDVLILLTWQMDFKEQALKLLETNSCDFSADSYEYIYKEFIKDFRRNDLPISIGETEKILEEEKNNFLQIQKTYSSFKKLNDKLVDKNIKLKPAKI